MLQRLYKTNDSAGTMVAFSMRSTSFAGEQLWAAINTLLKLNCYYGFKNKPVSYTDNAKFPSNNRESWCSGHLKDSVRK
jgi:hypothetical protein